MCMKKLDGCHTGSCPPCSISLVIPCRCGSTTRAVPCHTATSTDSPLEILCDRPCAALRACGRHQCNRICCPLAALGSVMKGKGKKRQAQAQMVQVEDALGFSDGAHWHTCGLACGKMLGCGNHLCEEPDHRGACPPCLRSSFEEASSLAFGRLRICCSIAAFIIVKNCVMGVTVELALRSAESLANCGNLPAHHGCAASCHAPAACCEDDPCQASITLRCACERIQQASLCGRCTLSPARREATQIKCTSECALAKRNARLAEALGISQDVKDRGGQRPTVYSDELVSFTHANARFCTIVEKSFSDFITSERKSQVLPYMHEARRKFVHDLAAIYRMDTQMVDQEPKRSVQLIRRVDTRIPQPLLSAAAGPSTNLGKLADLRSPVHFSAPTRPGSAQSTTQAAHLHIGSSHASTQGGARGWTSVVANSSMQAANGSASAWRSPSVAAAVGPNALRTNGIVHSIARAPVASRLVLNDQLRQGESNTTVENVPDNWENDDS
ncbi:hypothetical protein EW145_g3791 [Phellinidium pouzarii]|uniref:R3H domain-containing protein n=1 Tax=Phellinidium pouzarii TaxID=167371 RepID=A0A4S4LB28_9AGAM|nr:hypothetical protein EW145_g3791 [Phellinidium pouzarii]